MPGLNTPGSTVAPPRATGAPHTRYRPEIDGLRAIAVIPVLLFHAGFSLFAGGFVGVDVFFVISGYLITSLITDELASGTFSLLRFYERRARRILPALFLVLLACLPPALLWLSPEYLDSFSRTLVAVCLFASNVLFWETSGYFDVAASMKPLLHTWSLAVEEQYYLLFPVCMMLSWRLGRRRVFTLIAAIGVASLVAAQWAASAQPTLDFYLLPTRAWELMLGALAALHLRGAPAVARRHRWLDELGGCAGLALIACAVFTFDKKTPSPSLYTLVPTLGALLIILCAGKQTRVGRILGSRVPVAIGLVSYSAYLWHQPLFVFARARSFSEPSMTLMGVLCAASLGLAFLSWKYVETPFRRRPGFSARQILAYGIAGSVALIACGLLGSVSNGLPGRFNDTVLRAYDAANDKPPRRQECLTFGANYLAPERSCVLGSAVEPTGALLGDSHADALAGALDETLRRAHRAVREMTYAGCPPALGLERDDSPDYATCVEYNRRARDYIVSNPRLSTVIISSRWVLYLGHPDFDNGEGGVDANSSTVHVNVIGSGPSTRRDDPQKRALIIQKYVGTIEAYLQAGKRVVLVYPVPEVGWLVPRALLWKLRYDTNPGGITTSYAVEKRRNADIVAAFDRLQNPNLVRIRPERVLCNSFVADRCVATLGGRALYFDDNHLSNTGARLVVGPIVTALGQP